MILPARRLDGVGEYYFSVKARELNALRAQGKEVINLGIGSPDLPPHASVISALAKAASNPASHGYQNYKGSPVLRAAMADWYKRWYGVKLNPDSEILPLIGSKEGIMHICMTYLNPGDKVLVPDPGYPAYASAVKLAGGKIIPYALNPQTGWQPDFKQLEKIGREKAKLMIANYPNMPTGALPDTKLLKQLVSFAAKRGILLVYDNPYSFILNKKPLSILRVPGAINTSLELNSLSKSHNMAGWRVGLIAGHEQRISEILRFKSNMDNGTFLPIQLAAVKALQLKGSWYNALNKIYSERQKKVFQLLSILGCTFSRPQAGLFVWAGIPKQYRDGFEFSDKILKNYSIFIAPGGIFGDAGLRFVRASLCADIKVLNKSTQRVAADIKNSL